MQLTSTTSNSILSQDYNRSKDPLHRKLCQTVMWKRIFRIIRSFIRDRSFVNFELSLITVVMYLLIFIFDVVVV